MTEGAERRSRRPLGDRPGPDEDDAPGELGVVRALQEHGVGVRTDRPGGCVKPHTARPQDAARVVRDLRLSPVRRNLPDVGWLYHRLVARTDHRVRVTAHRPRVGSQPSGEERSKRTETAVWNEHLAHVDAKSGDIGCHERLQQEVGDSQLGGNAKHTTGTDGEGSLEDLSIWQQATQITNTLP